MIIMTMKLIAYIVKFMGQGLGWGQYEHVLIFFPPIYICIFEEIEMHDYKMYMKPTA